MTSRGPQAMPGISHMCIPPIPAVSQEDFGEKLFSTVASVCNSFTHTYMYICIPTAKCLGPFRKHKKKPEKAVVSS